ncbi:unnamed protein product, partial [Brassica napus]
ENCGSPEIYFVWIFREQQPAKSYAVTAVGDVVRTTLGPRGWTSSSQTIKGSVIISNDGATIMKLLDISSQLRSSSISPNLKTQR